MPQHGYSLRTLTQAGTQIDHSEDFVLDGSTLAPALLEVSLISADIEVPFAGEATDYTITFTTSLNVGPSSGCYVRYTFPENVDASGLDLTNIEGKGLFLGSRGAESTEVIDHDLLNEP